MAGFSIDLTGRTALVTGASSGIGRRFATVLAASGANVVVGARRVERLQELKSEIEAAGGRALAVAMDASDEASTVAAYDAAEDMFGAVDTVVANAGINNTATALKQPVEDFDAVFALNTRGVFLTAREGARRMIANGSAERGNGRVRSPDAGERDGHVCGVDPPPPTARAHRARGEGGLGCDAKFGRAVLVR